MPTLTLPRASRGTLRAFWIGASGGAAALAGLVAAGARRDPRALALALPVATALAVPGLRRPDAVRGVYEAWSRGGEQVGRLASSYVTTVTFGVMAATRGLGEPPDLPLASTGDSAWRPRSSQPIAAYRFQDTVPVPGPADAFERFARRPENAWAPALRPLIRLIGAVESPIRASEEPPSDVYTLY